MRFYKLLPLLLLVGCTETECPVQPTAVVNMEVSAQFEGTKTSISGTTLSWTANDEIGMFVGNIQSNAQFCNTPKALSTFSGAFYATGRSEESVNYYAYYPYTESASGTVVNATLPYSQAAPFDMTANYMVSAPVSAKYDERDMPSISLAFNTQLFALVKITVTNTDDTYKNETLKSIELISSEGKRMAGGFSFDVTSPVSSLVWSTTTPLVSKVSSDFSSTVAVGTNNEHVVYLFVRPDEYNGLQVCIRTDARCVKTSTSETVSLESNKVTTLPIIDFATDGSMKKITKIACWGDSYTHGVYAYPPHLQEYLGNEWDVYDGGYAGDRTTDVMLRQGAIKSYVYSGFTFPESESVSVQIDSFYLENSELTVVKDAYDGLRLERRGRLFNTLLISGVECTLSSDMMVARMTPGEEVVVPAGAEITTYGDRFCRDVDVNVIYMGSNGGWNRQSRNCELLVKQHWAMIKYANSKKYIVMAYHNRTEEDLLALYETAFYTDAGSYCPEAYDGQNHLLKLEAAVTKDWNRCVEMLLKSGVYSSEDEITQSDKDRFAAGRWPYPFLHPDKSHPSDEGEKVIAMLVHDKMIKLGYLEDNYILDDPTDL